MDSAAFHAAVYGAVRAVPHGHVTSYGHIAKLIGMPAHSRFVGQALKFLDPTSDVPWQRIISSAGQISLRGPDAQRQRDALEQEGVQVQANRSGGFTIDLQEYGWFPDALAD